MSLKIEILSILLIMIFLLGPYFNLTYKTTTLIISSLTLILLYFYVKYTYQIAKDTTEPFISFSLNQRASKEYPSPSHLCFKALNQSKMETEVRAKIWSIIDGEIFENKEGLYGDGASWFVQPIAMQTGHFELQEFTNKNGHQIRKVVKDKKRQVINLYAQIIYRKSESKKWKKSSPQRYGYDFKYKNFWLEDKKTSERLGSF